MKVYVLMENQAHEGGEVRGVYSTREKAEREMGEDSDIFFWTVTEVEADAPEGYQESFWRKGKATG